ncbi:MAG TPA: ABC transporter ATP-binding protein [Longimicrobiales bacterium]|nr:ABC transporter ATP-binding protein [Longimicrobiales bacterium]
MATIELLGVDKVYPGDVHAVRSLDLRVEDGERLVLLGPSGCGKSTVLRLVAGLEALTAGEIRVGERRVDTEPPQRRDVAMVFQGYALYGHMTVRGNLEFPLRMRGIDRQERSRRVEEVAALLELQEQLDARPGELSGGQQQRVAMGRALVREPRAFLLDEPLSNLDARLRTQVRAHIARIQERLGVTTLHVTHDQVEALTLGHRVAVMRKGRIQQIGTGQELYDRPANTFVAAFVGQPGMNLLAGRLEAGGERPSVDLGATSLRVAREALGPAGWGERVGRPVVLGVRPESLRLVGQDADGIPGRVETVESIGRERILYVSSDVVTVDAAGEPSAGAVDGAGPLIAVRTMPGQSGVAPGDRVALRPETDAIRLFDGEGLALGP